MLEIWEFQMQAFETRQWPTSDYKSKYKKKLHWYKSEI